MDKILGMDKLLVLFIVILIIIIAVAVGVSVNRNNDDKPDNGIETKDQGKRWEDLHKFKTFLHDNYTVVEKKDKHTELVSNIDDPGDAVWIIVGVEKEFTSEEASVVRNFVNDGGSVILASDSSLANRISLQFAVEFTEHRIIETERFDKNELFIPMEAYFGGTAYNILTNGPNYLDFNENVTTIDIDVIAHSSGWSGFGDFSFIDLNEDGIAGKEDEIAEFPAILEVSSGKGKIIFISDSGLFTDDLWERQTATGVYQNSDFAKDLLKYTVSRQGTVVYDLSKHETYQSGHLIYPD